MAFDMSSLKSNVPASGLVYTDITEKFRQAVAEMKTGEMVKDVAFSLFDAVPALEIMDPKMDIYCAEAQKEPEEAFDIDRQLTGEDLVGIIDKLVALEMAWHTGSSLSLTVFTSHYIDRLYSNLGGPLSNVNFGSGPLVPGSLLWILRSYIIGLLRSCSLVIDHVTQEHYYEEEDFVTNTFDRGLLDHIPVVQVLQDLSLAEEGIKILHETGTLSDAAFAALNARLSFRMHFLNAIEMAQFRAERPMVSGAWKDCVRLLGIVAETASVGVEVPEAFSAELQKKLSTNMPPRQIIQIEASKGLDMLKTLVTDSLEVTDVLEYHDPITIQNFVVYFQSRKPTPFVYVRSLLQHYLFKDFIVLGVTSLRTLMDDDIRITVDPHTGLLDPIFDEVCETSDPRYRIARSMETFRQRSAQCYLDVYRSICQNRCRVRRTLFHTVRDWDFLEYESRDMDFTIRMVAEQHNEGPHPDKIGLNAKAAGFMSGWAKLYKLRTMVLMAEMDFELDMHLLYGLAGMYWYYGVVVSCLMTHHNVISNSISPEQQSDPLTPKFKRKHIHYHALSLATLQLKSHLALGLRNILTILTRLGAIRPPRDPYGNEESRHKVRMRPYTLTTMRPPTLAEFQENEESRGIETEVLIQVAKESLRNVKPAVQKVKELTDRESLFLVGSGQSHKQGLEMAKQAGEAAEKVLEIIEQAIATGAKLKVENIDESNHFDGTWVVPTVHFV